ncbi:MULTISPECIES: hypothetical protein [Cupriavidus]|uniref:hypothetical protein n=1 Tax=Cupriavidus TaxID=106589 RepID=UPI00160003EA|nr:MULTISPECIES: hypothetical protein [Cupriavidus]MBB1631345.1 hypothetical protein [Cupriavidus sp. UME77]MCP3022875.1 hypothetical protein [Cupriavidus basilensis]
MNESELTIEQAYRAMFYFLEHEYELTKSDELGGILGSLSWQVWEGGHGPADPAAWNDWLEAVRKAKGISEGASSPE